MYEALVGWDYLVFLGYVVALAVVGLWAGRKEQQNIADYFLAGHTLPWYVVGGSFVASNVSSEHFLGMVGTACAYGICVAWWEWGNVATFTLLIWFFIPFLLMTKVFTTPEFLERRFGPLLRLFFAVVTIISNVVAFMAAVLYGGGLALHALFGWNLWLAILVLGIVAGSLAIYGGLRSVAWTDFLTLIVMVLGGGMVTLYGLDALSGGDSHSLLAGFREMLRCNEARDGEWAKAVAATAPHIIPGAVSYNRLTIIQPASHTLIPWPSLLLTVWSISIWYNVINQFMIQRVLAAKNMYHARMGIVFAGYLKILMPFLVVLPGLILFALRPDILQLPWDQVRPEADKGYVRLVTTLIPVGLRGLLLAALFGAIQSTVNSVLNSTATIYTVDIYQRLLKPGASGKALVRAGIWSSVVFLVISIALAGFISRLQGSLFEYIQSLYAFFAPPFAAVFLLGILFRRINRQGATVAAISGFVLGILMKIAVGLFPEALSWLAPFLIQSIVNWGFCVVVCVVVSLLTPRPRPEQVSDSVTVNWRRLNIFTELGDRWYRSVVFWWLLFCVIVAALLLTFSQFVYQG